MHIMDPLNIAVFGVALTVGMVQYLFEDGVSARGSAQRWWANSVLFVAHTSAVTVFAAAIAWLTRTDAAAAQSAFGIGAWPVAAQIVALLITQGFLQYWVHRFGHQIPVLWRLHRVHHTDTHLDATTGLRHHPLESLVDYVPFLALTLIVAPSAAGVLGYFLLGFAFAVFTHIDPNWVPARLDRALSLVIMTPRLHQLHHSTWQPETDTNYGNILTVWDRVFGTYLPAPATPRAGFALGLQEFPPTRAQDPFLLIASPFLAADQRKDSTPTA
jgi:sterol desaturase/sphingolipid hydroxylase (fatty acid hydroxylase superfamily)